MYMLKKCRPQGLRTEEAVAGASSPGRLPGTASGAWRFHDSRFVECLCYGFWDPAFVFQVYPYSKY